MNAKANTAPITLIAGVALLFAAVPNGRAQQTGLQHANNFTSTEYYEQPHQQQIKSILSGAEALPQPGGLLIIKQLRLETFDLDGKLEVTIMAPECIYDTFKGVANSPGHLQVQTGDGKFRVEGDGFLWRQSDSFLTISNNVRTVIENTSERKAAAAPNTPADKSQTRISSDQGEFDMTRRRVTYHGHVRVDDPELKLAGEWLITDLPQADEHVSHIVAETNVVIDSMGDQGQTNHATCARAVYNYEVKDGTTNELVTLTGNATVENAEYILTGEPIAWNRANNLITAIHQLIIPRKGLINANASAPSTPAAPKTSGAESQTRISSDWGEFDMTRRRATCHGHVRVDDPEMKLTSEWLITELPQANEHVSHIVAETNVVIDSMGDQGQTNHATCARAVYNYEVKDGTTNELVTLTGNATVENAEYIVTGEPIAWNRANNLITAIHQLIIPRKGLINANASAPSTPAAPKTSGAESQTRISSDWGEFDMTGRRATCHGHVRMDDPEMKLTGEWLITELPPAGAHISHIVAETNVVIDFADEKGQTNHVTGDKAVYLYSKQGGVTNETVTLTGNPRMENAQGTQAGDVIVWNRVNNKFHFDNPYMIPRQNINGASPDTNTPVTVEKTNFPPGTIENIDKNISDHLSDHINHPPF